MIKKIKSWLNDSRQQGNMVISMIRREYQGKPLDETMLMDNPVEQFQIWFDDAKKESKFDSNAMILGTSTKAGKPSTRTVLLKGFDDTGFVFYTNYDSRKGSQLEENPQASLTLYWPEMSRQVNIEGKVARTNREESAAYFASRPLGSRVSAAASPQSSEVESRTFLEHRVAEIRRESGGDVECPENWGGYRLNPERIEFWQGRVSRLHDRFVYLRDGNSWTIKRLAP